MMPMKVRRGGEVQVGEGGGGVDGGERVGPGAEHRGGEQCVACGLDGGDVHADHGGVEVDGVGGGGVEDAGEAAGAQDVEGEDEVGGPGGVGAVVAGPGGGAEVAGAFGDDAEDIRDRRVGARERGVEDVDGAAEDDFLRVAEGASPDEGAEGEEEGEAP
jgi:hypothetical protein